MNTNSILSRVLFLTCTWIFSVSVYAPFAISSDTPSSSTDDTPVNPNETDVSKELRGRNHSTKESDRAKTAFKLESPNLLEGSAALLTTGQSALKPLHIPTLFRTATLGAYRARKALASDTREKRSVERRSATTTIGDTSDDLPKLNLAKDESSKMAIQEIKSLESARTSVQEQTSHKHAPPDLCNSQPNPLRDSIEKLILIPEGVIPPADNKRAESPFESEYVIVVGADWEQRSQANEPQPRKEPPKLEQETNGAINLGPIEWSHFREN